jgi:hypothetical protein
MKAKYYHVSRLVFLPDYQGIGVGKRFLNFIAELYSSQTTEKFAPQKPSIISCVSKDSMAAYMDYLYFQRPIDGIYHNLTITGVPVKLTAIGSGGTATDIGTVTANGYYGTFGTEWTPPK